MSSHVMKGTTMDILRFEHDEKHKRELFGWIGEACASAAVRAELGGPITSSPGNVWFLAVEGKRLLGFCGVSVSPKTKKAKLHGMVVLEPTKNGAIEETLHTSAEIEAMGRGAGELLSVDKEEKRKTFETLGWKAIGERGKQYRIFSKTLEADR